jgi:hypothetical protein
VSHIIWRSIRFAVVFGLLIVGNRHVRGCLKKISVHRSCNVVLKRMKSLLNRSSSIYAGVHGITDAQLSCDGALSTALPGFGRLCEGDAAGIDL